MVLQQISDEENANIIVDVITSMHGLHYNLNVYQFIRKSGGWDNWDMVELEKYAATDKRDLHTRERYWVDALQPALNRQIPTRTTTEHYLDNKETIKVKHKQYRVDNKESLKVKQKEYREATKENIKQYRYDNKEAIKLKTKQYYESNKESISAHKKTQLNCIHCGSTTTNHSKSRHEKTNKCIYNQIYNFIHS